MPIDPGVDGGLLADDSGFAALRMTTKDVVVSEHGCRRMTRDEYKAAKKAGLIKKACGTVKERNKNCPDLFPPAHRSSCCCPPDTELVGDCRCRPKGSSCSEVAQRCELVYPEDTDGATATKVCTGDPQCPAGAVCMYGKMGDKDCNPDADGCVPWADEIFYGQRPEIVSAEVSE